MTEQVSLSSCDTMINDKSNYYYVRLQRSALTGAEVEDKCDILPPSFPLLLLTPRAFKSHLTDLTHPLLFFLAHAHTRTLSSHICCKQSMNERVERGKEEGERRRRIDADRKRREDRETAGG